MIRFEKKAEPPKLEEENRFKKVKDTATAKRKKDGFSEPKNYKKEENE